MNNQVSPSERDIQIAASCGINREEAVRIFQQAARRHKEIAEFYDEMYRPRLKRDDGDPGETPREVPGRYARFDR